jgi:hypothetical protein
MVSFTHPIARGWWFKTWKAWIHTKLQAGCHRIPVVPALERLELGVQGQPGLHGETLSQNKQNKSKQTRKTLTPPSLAVYL